MCDGSHFGIQARLVNTWHFIIDVHALYDRIIKSTLPETNLAPENWWLKDEFPFGARPIFKGELLVSQGG